MFGFRPRLNATAHSDARGWRVCCSTVSLNGASAGAHLSTLDPSSPRSSIVGTMHSRGDCLKLGCPNAYPTTFAASVSRAAFFVGCAVQPRTLRAGQRRRRGQLCIHARLRLSEVRNGSSPNPPNWASNGDNSLRRRFGIAPIQNLEAVIDT